MTTSAILAAALVALVIAGGAYLYVDRRTRRAERGEIRELVDALESVRTGRHRPHASTRPESRLALLHDAMGRLSHDALHLRREADGARESLEAVLAAARDLAILQTDGDGDVRHANGRAAELFGRDAEELSGRPAAELFDEDSYREVLPRLARRALREQGVRTRATMVRQDGSTFPADVSVRQSTGSAGQPLGFLIVVRDRTEQDRLENDLRASEARYRALVEGLDDPCAVVRGDRILYANPAFAERWPDEEGEVDRSMRAHVATRDLLWFDETLERLERAGSEESFVVRLGPAVPPAEFAVTGRGIAWDGGPAVLLVLRDETLRRRLDGELRANESQLDAIVEATSDGLLVLAQTAGRLRARMTNRSFCALVGLEADELLGRRSAEVARLLRERGPGGAAVAQTIDADPPRATEEVRWAEDPPRDVEIRWLPLRGPGGDVLGRVLALRDRTAQRRSERELQQYADKLQLSKARLAQAYGELDRLHKDAQRRNRELDRVNAELRKLDAMKSNLLGNVTHELQTPLVSIRGYTEMISKGRLGPVTEEQRKGLALSLKNIDRLISMIDGLLSFARAETELGRLELSRFPLRPLLAEVEATFAHAIRERALTFEVVFEGLDDVRLEADRPKLEQVLENLVSNAVKFTPEGGSIAVEVRPKDAEVVEIAVRDNGAGIPSDRIDRVFDRLDRAGREDGDGPKGTGLGLSIARDIVRLHGCRIDVESEVGRGTAFRFTMPRADGAGSMGRGADDSARTPREGAGSGEPAHRNGDGNTDGNGDGSGDGKGGGTPAAAGPRPRPRFRIIRPEER